jgi:hypothetical protein
MLSIHRDASKILERVKTTKEEEIDGINQRRIVLPQRDGVTEPSVRLGHRHSKKRYRADFILSDPTAGLTNVTVPTLCI